MQVEAAGAADDASDAAGAAAAADHAAAAAAGAAGSAAAAAAAPCQRKDAHCRRLMLTQILPLNPTLIWQDNPGPVVLKGGSLGEAPSMMAQ